MGSAPVLRACLTLHMLLAASAAFTLKYPLQPAHSRHLGDLRKLYIDTLKKSVTGVLLQVCSYCHGRSQLSPCMPNSLPGGRWAAE
jgi:hypothetical protein